MNKVFIGIVLGIVLFIGFFIFNSYENEFKNPFEEKKEETKQIKHLEKIETDKKQNKNIKEANTQNNKIYKDKYKKENKRNNEIILNKSEFSDFLQKNDLEEIKSLDNNIKIYAKSLPEENQFAPPMPPILVKLKFKENSEVVPLNSNLINLNKKIYVVKKKNDKYFEVKEIDTNKLTSFTPPSIGQN